MGAVGAAACLQPNRLDCAEKPAKGCGCGGIVGHKACNRLSLSMVGGCAPGMVGMIKSTSQVGMKHSKIGK